MSGRSAPIEPPGARRRVERVIGARDGAAPGPTLIVVGGVHGNEPAGVVAARRVLDAIDAGLLLARGRFVALHGNTTALGADAPAPWRRPRYVDHDLNRLFGIAHRGVGSVEGRERDELCDALRREAERAEGRCVVLDLHTVSSASPPFIAVEDSLAARRFAMRFGLPLVLGIEEELDGLLMDYATGELGCVSLTVEAGRHQDDEAPDLHERVIRGAMCVLGMHADPCDETAIFDGLRRASAGRGRHVYDIRHRAVIADPSFRVRDGADAFMRVRAGRTAVADEGGREVVAEESGMLFMPSRQPVHRVGDDAFFVVRRVGRVWLGVSAWVRSRPWVHVLLPRVLPGVRRREGRHGELLVAPEIAAVFRREVFHLLGYRLVRFEKSPHVPPARRVVAGAWVAARSVGRVLAGALRGGERGVLPAERPTDWVVRRRALDVRGAQRSGRGA